MRKIIASLDIGSSLIKLVVGEIQKNRVNILACVESPSQGVKQGYIVNPDSAFYALKETFEKAKPVTREDLIKFLKEARKDYTDEELEFVKNKFNELSEEKISPKL